MMGEEVEKGVFKIFNTTERDIAILQDSVYDPELRKFVFYQTEPWLLIPAKQAALADVPVLPAGYVELSEEITDEMIERVKKMYFPNGYDIYIVEDMDACILLMLDFEPIEKLYLPAQPIYDLSGTTILGYKSLKRAFKTTAW